MTVLSLCWAGRLSAQSLFEECQQKKAQIEQMKAQVQQMLAEIAGLSARIADLERQKQELLRQRSDKEREKARLENTIRVDENMMRRSCAGLEECNRLEQRIEALRQRMEPLRATAQAIRSELDSRRAEQDRLEAESNRLAATYNQLNCGNLVAGQAEQQVIDQCHNIFSSWNQMEKDLNQLEAQIRDLRARHTQLLHQLRAQQAEIALLLRKMRSSCPQSGFVAQLEQMDNEGRDWVKWEDQLKVMENRMGQIRKLKVVKPVIKPVGPGPTLKPVKKHELKKVQ